MSRLLIILLTLLPLVVPLPAAASGHGGGGEGGPQFVTLTELRVPIVQGDRADGRLLVTLALKVDDSAEAAAINGVMPAVRERAMMATSEFARLHASPYLPVDAERLAKAIDGALHDQVPGAYMLLVTKVSAVTA
jgi:hypothetical protein